MWLLFGQLEGKNLAFLFEDTVYGLCHIGTATTNYYFRSFYAKYDARLFAVAIIWLRHGASDGQFTVIIDKIRNQ